MNRKNDHLKLALQQKTLDNSFDNYEIEYHSIPNFGIEDIDTKSNIGGIILKFPFFINAITGGSSKGDMINSQLEEVAKETDIFFFPGSYSPFLNDDNNNYPKNFGVNLGIDKSVEKHIKAVNVTNAKLLQVHVNMIQEMLMPEGDKNFKDWEKNLKEIVKNVNIPIVLKETGFGMSKQTIQKGIDLGIKIFDVSGNDGTSFSKIENARSNNPKPYYESIGYTTTQSILNAKEFDDIQIIASGGIRNPLDVIKALALGANAVGVSKTFLEILENKGKNALIYEINEWKKDILNIMLITQSKNLSELVGKIKTKF